MYIFNYEYSWWNGPLKAMKYPTLCLTIFFAIYFSDMSIVTPHVLRLLFLWYTFLILSLSISLCLWIWSVSPVNSCMLIFKSNMKIDIFWLNCLIHLHLFLPLIWLDSCQILFFVFYMFCFCSSVPLLLPYFVCSVTLQFI